MPTIWRNLRLFSRFMNQCWGFEMKNITIAGNIGRDAEVRNAGDKRVTGWTVAVEDVPFAWCGPMTSAKHTPGPWMVPHFAREDSACNCKYVLAEYGGMGSIATIDAAKSDEYDWGDDYGPDLETAKANAHLISAAPEMYQALVEFCRRVDAGEVRSSKTYASFKNIIAKVEGN